jgi:dipeptidyl aminopeptidase/acylaminoacyl peptidase
MPLDPALLDDTVRSVDCPFPMGRLYVPSQRGAHPGIVLLHGSEGGRLRFVDGTAVFLARAGFAALVLPYFGVPQTPPRLHRVELSKTVEALDWLRQCWWVKGRAVGLYGASRGAEHALFVASLVRAPRLLRAVAVHAPPATTWGAFDPFTRKSLYTPLGNKEPAWTLEGRPVPSGVALEIEQYEGPVFISHGTQDEIWPALFSRTLEQRLRQAGREVEVLYLEGEGHVPSPAVRAMLAERRLAFFRRHLG